jgi:hypothetical protein
MATSGNRSLEIRAVTGSYAIRASGHAPYYSSGNQFAYFANVGIVITTTYQYITAWDFTTEGDTAIYHIHDTTNGRAYRITLIVGAGYTDNMISIERLHPNSL